MRTSRAASPTLMKLSPARKALLEILGRLNFGRMEGLEFRNGEPVLDDPRPRIVATLRFGEGEGAGPSPSLEGLAARPAVQQLMQHMDRMLNGKFARIEIRAGSPVFCEVEIPSSGSGGGRA